MLNLYSILKGKCTNDEMKYVNKLMKNMWLNVWRDIGKEIKCQD